MARRTASSLATERQLLERLREVLSDEELQRVLACALLVLDAGAQPSLFERLGPETGATLRAALRPARGGKPLRATLAPGKAKLLQDWERLWQEWHAVIDETGLEEGKYVMQDASWEAPYFERVSVAEDLDAIAARLRPLLPRVIDEGLAPAVSFSKALSDLDQNLGQGLPDWLLSGGEGSTYLGGEVTSCWLEWEWRVAQREGIELEVFTNAIRDFEADLDTVSLDQDTIVRFFLALPLQPRRALHESLLRQRTSKRWTSALSSPRGAWARLLEALPQNQKEARKLRPGPARSKKVVRPA